MRLGEYLKGVLLCAGLLMLGSAQADQLEAVSGTGHTLRQTEKKLRKHSGHGLWTFMATHVMKRQQPLV